MTDTRRQILRAAASFAAVLFTPRLLAQIQNPHPEFHPYPKSQNADEPASPKADKQTLYRQNQEHIREAVDKMFVILSEMKEQLGATNTDAVLSVGFVKKAHEVEKLAKQVKELAKG